MENLLKIAGNLDMVFFRGRVHTGDKNIASKFYLRSFSVIFSDLGRQVLPPSPPYLPEYLSNDTKTKVAYGTSKNLSFENRIVE